MSANHLSNLALRGAPSAIAQNAKNSAKNSADYTLHVRQAITVLHEAAALGDVTQASSLGSEDVVITNLINQLQLHIPVFVLDTGALHTETLALLERTQATSRTPINVYRPERVAVMQFVRSHGQKAIYDSVELRKNCCDIRKMEPLGRALAGKRGWITGLRREQSNTRAEVPLTEAAAPDGSSIAKFNPLANWTWGDIWHYIAEHAVDYNPLHDQFYPSIGCAPCTRAVTLGEDFRSGRWWWENDDARECGLHVKPHSDAPASLAAHRADRASEVPAQAHAAEGGARGAPAPGRSQNEDLKEWGLHVKRATTPNEQQQKAPA